LRDAIICFTSAVNEDDVDHYVRHGSVAIDRWSPPEDGDGIDHAINWKLMEIIASRRNT